MDEKFQAGLPPVESRPAGYQRPKQIWTSVRNWFPVGFLLTIAFLWHFSGRDIAKYHPIAYPEDVVFGWDKVKPSPELHWHPCAKNRECARFEVPMDHTNSAVPDKVAIALIRIRAKVSPDSKEYRGPILFNPGGPGGSGVQFIDRIGEQFQKLLGEEYDIVGFDPRGIGRTTPRISLFQDEFERGLWDIQASFIVNASTESLTKEYARSMVMGKLATETVNYTAQYVSTAMVARDMLAITRAHGREKLQYWGFSYGTVLGSTYAAMFPNNIDRLVIDGVVELSDYYTGRWYSNLVDTDNILKFWADECVAAGDACPLTADSSMAVLKRVHNIFESIRSQPLAVVNGSTYGVIQYDFLKMFLFQGLYKPFAALPSFTSALAALEAGEGLPMLSLMGAIKSLPSCSSPPNAPISGSEGGTAVLCGEGLGAGRTLDDITQHLEGLSELSIFADVWTATTRLRCVNWNIATKERYGGEFNTTTSFPLLIIGNTADPVTPLMGARKAAAGFPNSRLLTVNTPGHCSLAGTSPDAVGYIRNYFRDGTLPPKDTVCEVEDKLFGEKKDLLAASTLLKDPEVLEAARSLSAKAEVGRMF